MANRAEITCVAQNDRHSTYERITHIGGYVTKPWKLSIKQAIKYVDDGKWQFFVKRGEEEVMVEARTSRSGSRYLKTVADRDAPEDLLSLPNFPDA